MCGISGCLDASPRAEEMVARLNAEQAHRGPDDAVVSRAGPYALGNTRLAIQDPTPTGNQPFWSKDNRYCAVFNGEIYNFRELAREFSLEHDIRCDGTVIPDLWSRMGPECLPRFRGMYAIAVADRDTGTLWLARDPFGIKPLYWRAFGDGRMAFASEPRPLARLAQAPVSQTAVAHFLRWGAVAPDESAFDRVESLRPNECLRFEGADLRRRDPIIRPGATWFAASPTADDGAAEAATSFRHSVDLHLRSDVPTVLLLSSGVDSAAVASAARALGHDLHCMTVGLSTIDDETPAAATTARHYGHDHQVVPAELDDTTVDRFFAAMQRPTIDGLNMFLVSAAVRSAGFKVALSGLGADEGLGGYRQFRLANRLGLIRLAQHLPAVVTRMALGLGGRLWAPATRPKTRRLLGPAGPANSWDLDRLVREVTDAETVFRLTGITPAAGGASSACPPEVGQLPPAQAIVAAELRLYLQTMLLPDTDAFSMANSVELRVPFLDTEFFPAAVAAMAHAKELQGKPALAQALDDPYLLALTRRPKRGFSVPIAQWAREGALKPLVDGLADPAAPVWDHVDRAQAGPLASGDGATNSSTPASDGDLPAAWPLVVLNNWLLSLRSSHGPVGAGEPR
ncbi:MAG TPA: asparagine synthetase B [Acidimicrobiales bacterium]|nr:asparagine synthetase B [Acidimicrobiales bacterium]